MATRRPKGSVSFHDAPPDTSSYSDIIARAKAKNDPKPEDLQGTPRFDRLDSSWKAEDGVQPGEEKETLSKETESGLRAVLEANAAKQEMEARSEETPTTSPRPVSPEPEPELTPEEKMRAAVEARLSPLDIGEYLMSGEARQAVPIIPGKLEVTFRTVVDLEEVFVDGMLAQQKEMTGRQYIRISNEWALAVHVYEVNGNRWPSTIDGDGTVSEKVMEQRLSHVRRLSSPVFTLMVQNLGFFLERVNNGLSLEVLGNG